MCAVFVMTFCCNDVIEISCKCVYSNLTFQLIRLSMLFDSFIVNHLLQTSIAYLNSNLDVESNLTRGTKVLKHVTQIQVGLFTL